MDRKDLEVYCKENGIPCDNVGDKMRVMDLSRMPDVMRAHFDERGFLRAEQSETPPLQSGAEPPKPLKGKLPADFPGHAALEAAGVTTYAKLRKRLGDLTEIAGIGEATAEKITTEMGASSEEEEEQESE